MVSFLPPPFLGVFVLIGSAPTGQRWGPVVSHRFFIHSPPVWTETSPAFSGVLGRGVLPVVIVCNLFDALYKRKYISCRAQSRAIQPLLLIRLSIFYVR